MMKKYSVIAVASLLATNLLTFPSSSLAEIENKTRNSIEAFSYIQSNEKSELQQQLEAVKERQIELEKREEILKQQKELFVKVDELKRKKDELLKQDGEQKVQLEEVQQELDELKKMQAEIEEQNQLQVRDNSEEKKTTELKKQEEIEEKNALEIKENNSQEEKKLEELEEQKKKEELKKQQEELRKQQEQLKKQQLELEQKTKQELELTKKEEQAKQELELKQKEEQAKQELELKQKEEQAKQELELKQKEEQAKQELELKQKEEQAKQELEWKQKEEQEKRETELKQATITMQAAPQSFPDVPRWAEESVYYLVNKKVISGMPDGTFSPSKVLSRAEAATIMAKILGLEVKEGEKPTFTDSQDHWATPYIAAVEKAGVIKGEGNGKFNPNGQMTRAAMATMLVQAYQLEKKVHEELSTLFPDVKDHWGEKFINILVSMGISSGVDGGRWQPDRSITRAEAAQLVAVTDKSKDNELKMKKISISKKFFTYNGPSLSSGISKEYGPREVTVYEERDGGWIRIHTDTGFKWVCLVEKKVNMNKNFLTYNEASLSSGISGEYAPQSVTVIEEREGNWIKVYTALGYKWVCLIDKKVQIDRDFTTYDAPFRSANILDYYGPQAVTVVEERGTWLRIRTYAGYQWLDTKKEAKYLSKVFFAYDSPSFVSRVSGRYAPQTVEVYGERDGGWIQIQTSNGLKWVNEGNINRSQVILNVPSLYQFPELHNGCEVVSLQMLVEHQIGRSLNKVVFAFEMPFDQTKLKNYKTSSQIWGDPDVGFVGDVTGNTPGYSINPEPLKRLLDKYARGTNLTGNDLSVLEDYVRNGKPVVTWVTVALNNPRPITTWKTPGGKTISARMNTHAVVLTGVDDNYVYYNDPFYGTKNVKVSKSRFASIYNQMGKKALSVD
ncbi:MULTISPECIES: S-layer homology domain-containing protein [Bacillus]|uniref:S-layer homology domain-containing protein n=1 Tax=Bacillus TaxID=1386 RepID=UPI001064E384|nr:MULTISPECIES: S-layer homology domain-containing protein [Bacillus]MCU4949849.1 S-layer homology domain-containing protein [Bacillus paranthracis]MDA1498439.1 S-layer homology domain-containing protein [Bacillus cereus group sp. TH41-1LC]MDA1684311.1 S-layer homology domain-containing protein [Bacillus cereus group sp. m2-21]MDA1694950.1 S-layer homology domain-containing protein [Bacillus cereus group sp. m1-2]MDA1704971.1 S-layer homology domain-containing protein [Bacillus cereus group s